MKKEVSDFSNTVGTIFVYTFFYFGPTILGGQRHSSCTMNTAHAYAMFAWFIIGAQALVSLGWIIGYYCQTMRDPPISELKKYVEKATFGCTIANAFIMLFGYTIYFFWC